MRVAVSGAHGLIGSALVARLIGDGARVVRLVRGEARGRSEVFWDPGAGEVDAAGLEGLDAVVHLAGEGISGRWTAAKRERIRDSRVVGTAVLAEALAGLDRPPKVLASASAIGYYGDRGEELLTERSGPGEGFLAELCGAWEAAAAPAAERGIRVVPLRFGLVLSPAGGVLAEMLPLFGTGLGGVLGGGGQYWSWIALPDAVAAVEHVLVCGALSGAVNVAAPHPVTNEQFARTLAAALGRSVRLPRVPAFALRLAFGAMADAVMLTSARISPGRLCQSGFVFRFPRLAEALAHMLEKRSTPQDAT